MRDPEPMADPERTKDIYERHARGFDARRPRVLFEEPWLQRFAAHLPPGGRVLDLGCGAGQPIAEWLIEAGFRVTGVDFAQPMLDIARSRYPEAEWLLQDMRALDLGRRFHGIVGWDSFFHLTPDEQRACLRRLAEHLETDGVLLLTVGPDAGEVTGVVEGDSVYHASLSPAEYAAVLEACGLRLTAFLAEDQECDEHSVLVARKVEGDERRGFS